MNCNTTHYRANSSSVPGDPTPHKVYHMPISQNDCITDLQLKNKLNGLNDSRELNICYIGRAIEMKGPIDWLKILHELIKSGVKINATWLGDGFLLPQMRTMAETLGISKYVRLAGYISDRKEILQTLRNSDLFLFCHKTPESPRCLVEALASGCPLVGYGSAYPKDLVARCGGGSFVSMNNWMDLANLVKDLDKDRGELRDLVRSASVSGRLYDQDTAMQHRIDLIKGYLRPEVDQALPVD